MPIFDTLSRIGMAKLPNMTGGANPAPVNTGGLLGGLRRSFTAPGMVDRLSMFGAQLQDIDDGGSRARTMQADALARQQAEEAAAARAALNAALLGNRVPVTAQGGAGGMNVPVPATGGAVQGGTLPRLRDVAPALLAANQAGLDVGDIVNVLDRAAPEVQVVNGVAYDPRDTTPGTRIGTNLSNVNNMLVDTQDPANANRYVPQVDAGQEIVYDANGQPMVRMIPGYVEGRGQLAATVAGSTAAAQTPFQIETVIGPSGERITTSRQNILQGGGIVGQSDADRAYNVQTATDRANRENTQAERASAAARILPSLDRMETLLPNVISGFGADTRLQIDRARAAVGDTGAQERVAATQTFQNEARQIVASIIRTFGANPTEGERNYAERMSGADVQLDPAALAEGIRLARARAERDLNAAGGNRQSGLGPVAINRQTGERVQWNGSAWVRVQ